MYLYIMLKSNASCILVIGIRLKCVCSVTSNYFETIVSHFLTCSIAVFNSAKSLREKTRFWHPLKEKFVI